jgi:glycerol-3-phosphate dehydrogenase
MVSPSYPHPTPSAPPPPAVLINTCSALSNPPHTHTHLTPAPPAVLIKDPCGLITITGGKWTTYRRMAQDAVDAAVASGRLPPATFCRTQHLRLLGGEYYHETMHVDVAQQSATAFGRQLDSTTCKHLCRTYGDQAYTVLQIGERLARAVSAPVQHAVLSLVLCSSGSQGAVHHAATCPCLASHLLLPLMP